MSKIYFEIIGDVVIKHTPMPEIGKDFYKTEVVMTKDIFQECYKKWVAPQESVEQMEKEKQNKANSCERITIIENEIEELSKRVKNVEDLIKEDKEEQLRKLKADSEYLKFRLNLDEESSRMKVRNK